MITAHTIQDHASIHRQCCSFVDILVSLAKKHLFGPGLQPPTFQDSPRKLRRPQPARPKEEVDAKESGDAAAHVDSAAQF